MKVLLSWLREFVDVRDNADEIARVMSLRGFAVEGIERLGLPAVASAEVGSDVVIDFEVTGNRPDCMSVIGMAREIATAFHLPLKIGVAGPASMADSTKPEPAPPSSPGGNSGPGSAERTGHLGGPGDPNAATQGPRGPGPAGGGASSEGGPGGITITPAVWSTSRSAPHQTGCRRG